MSEQVYSSTRKLLVNDSGVTALVPAGSIYLGFGREKAKYPNISITRVGGSTYGGLGYGTSTAGTKRKRDDVMIQIDIYSRDSMLATTKIGDQVDSCLLAGSGARKLNDNDMYENESNSYRKVQTWSFWNMNYD